MRFEEAVNQRNWAAALDCLCKHSDEVEEIQKARRIINKQYYHDLLRTGDHNHALAILQGNLAPAERNFTELSNLAQKWLLQPDSDASVNDLHAVKDELTSLLAGQQDFPAVRPRRLEGLLRQALAYQASNCIVHEFCLRNGHGNTGLFKDHMSYPIKDLRFTTKSLSELASISGKNCKAAVSPNGRDVAFWDNQALCIYIRMSDTPPFRYHCSRHVNFDKSSLLRWGADGSACVWTTNIVGEINAHSIGQDRPGDFRVNPRPGKRIIGMEHVSEVKLLLSYEDQVTILYDCVRSCTAHTWARLRSPHLQISTDRTYFAALADDNKIIFLSLHDRSEAEFVSMTLSEENYGPIKGMQLHHQSLILDCKLGLLHANVALERKGSIDDALSIFSNGHPKNLAFGRIESNYIYCLSSNHTLTIWHLPTGRRIIHQSLPATTSAVHFGSICELYIYHCNGSIEYLELTNKSAAE